MACALFYTRLPLANSVRFAPGPICQPSARSVPGRVTPPPPHFFISAESKGLRAKSSRKCALQRVCRHIFFVTTHSKGRILKDLLSSTDLLPLSFEHMRVKPSV